MVKLKRVNKDTDYSMPKQNYTIITTTSTENPEKICDRCGRPISNIIRVKGEDEKTYNVGTDCAELLGAK